MFKVGWGNSKQNYIVWQRQGDINSTSYVQAIEASCALLAQIAADVPFLIDLRGCDYVALIDVLYKGLLMRPDIGPQQLVILGSSVELMQVYTALSSELDKYLLQLKIVEDVDQAYAALMQFNENNEFLSSTNSHTAPLS
ncbi:MAG: hypothetical protein AAF846_26845 [Chloroflexota bacterium]